MKLRTFLICMAVVLASGPHVSVQTPGSVYNTLFAANTMRVDYFHTGGRGLADIISLDRVVSDGPWPGSRTRLVDRLNLGAYLFDVVDRGTNQSSIQGLRIAVRRMGDDGGAPRGTPDVPRVAAVSLAEAPVQVVREEAPRGPGAFARSGRRSIDRIRRFVDAAERKPVGTMWTSSRRTPAEKVDLLVLAEGYTRQNCRSFTLTKRLVARCSREEPFKSRNRDFNVRAIDLATATIPASTGRRHDDSGAHRSAPNTTSSIPSGTC